MLEVLRAEPWHREENGAKLRSPCQKAHALALSPLQGLLGCYTSLRKDPFTSLGGKTNCSRDSKENQPTLFMGKQLP